jgi:SAM-dependent methyltransferase
MSNVKDAVAARPVPRWKQRLKQISQDFDEIRFPRTNGRAAISQDQEWCEVKIGDAVHSIRFHDYAEIYRIPGLYESLFYQRLKCCSPSRVVRLLGEVLKDHSEDFTDLRVLDVGAGNGVVGDELHARRVDALVGVDIIPEAKEAAARDRPGVYDDYLVADLTELSEADDRRLRGASFNCLTTVAALGFGDIPDAAFIQALDLVETPGWLAFNIKQDFLEVCDPTGFSRLVRQLSDRNIICIEAYRRYRHRLSIGGEPLYYVAMVARKMRETPEDLLAACNR